MRAEAERLAEVERSTMEVYRQVSEDSDRVSAKRQAGVEAMRVKRGGQIEVEQLAAKEEAVRMEAER